MKSSVIIRIVVWSVVALLLLSVLILGLSGRISFFNIPMRILDDVGGYISYQDEERFTPGGATISMNGITRIDVDWVEGRVDVERVKGDEISFSETSRIELNDEHMLQYYVNGDRLIIKYCKSRVNLVGMWQSLDKRLTLCIPEDILLENVSIDTVSAQVLYQGPGANKISIESVSGGLSVLDVQAGEIDLESVSGEISVKGCVLNKANAETVSGNTWFTSCELDRVSADSISGNLRVEPGVNAQNISLKSISGSVWVTLAENDGFKARYSSASGNLSCEFPAQIDKKTAIYKDGGMDIDFDTVSGDMYIEQE